MSRRVTIRSQHRTRSVTQIDPTRHNSIMLRTVALLALVAGASASSCYSDATTIVPDCECHSSCETCGYSSMPNAEDDCITCASSGDNLHVVYGDGTGTCSVASASASSTTILCAANQRVFSKVCTACPAGESNAAGDDASGSDTTCTPPCTCCQEKMKKMGLNIAGECTVQT